MNLSEDFDMTIVKSNVDVIINAIAEYDVRKLNARKLNV